MYDWLFDIYLNSLSRCKRCYLQYDNTTDLCDNCTTSNITTYIELMPNDIKNTISKMLEK